ncbi:ABC transporter ATP-binding protein [Streptomyces sp. NPDC048389]|uniref:ABC transporter ATP-binding protein n=1 Tax=Streptomyces sp. NPDC048389 TaxID=3154622 RepID=UPI003452017D
MAVNSVLTQLFADGPTADKLREALPSLAVLAVAAVATAVLSAWSTAMSGRLEPQVERAVSARYYTAVTGVEVEATERPEVQRILEAGKFGTDSARSMLRLSVGVGNVVIAIRTSTARLTSLVQQVNRLYEELLFLTDTEDAIAAAGENAIPLTGTPLPVPVREVRTEAVSVTYPGADGPSLKGVSVCVPRGKVTALVGANGSGKTTLTKVLAGLLLPTEGDVWWVGESGERVGLREADRAQVFAEVGLLAQDFPRWEMTAAANVAIGAGDRPRDMDRVRKAAGEANVLELVEGLPHGWDSIVFKGYERGVQLSGGQWQKLGTARTRYRQAPFLLVDEPTSALDPHAEIAAFQGLWSLAEKGHAVVLVTHRLAATMHADHIYVLDQGRVVEDGTHEDLMAREGGLYQGMFTAQAAQYGLAPGTDRLPGPRGVQPSGHEAAS